MRRIKRCGGAMLVTADHGNAEQMIDPETGGPQTAHTTNPVPFIYIAEDAEPVHAAPRWRIAGHIADRARRAGHSAAERDDGARSADQEDAIGCPEWAAEAFAGFGFQLP